MTTDRITWTVSLPGKEILGRVGVIELPAFRLWLETLTYGRTRWVLTSNMHGQVLDVAVGTPDEAGITFLQGKAELWFTEIIGKYGAAFPLEPFSG